jgi:hypothetical protein
MKHVFRIFYRYLYFLLKQKKTGRLKNKMLSIELKIKFRLLNAPGSYIRKYKISNH